MATKFGFSCILSTVDFSHSSFAVQKITFVILCLHDNSACDSITKHLVLKHLQSALVIKVTSVILEESNETYNGFYA